MFMSQLHEMKSLFVIGFLFLTCLRPQVQQHILKYGCLETEIIWAGKTEVYKMESFICTNKIKLT